MRQLIVLLFLVFMVGTVIGQVHVQRPSRGGGSGGSGTSCPWSLSGDSATIDKLIGIGTTSPSQLLTVSSSDVAVGGYMGVRLNNDNRFIKIGNSGDDVSQILFDDNDELIFGQEGSFARDGSGVTELMRIKRKPGTNDPLVGIGTDSPAYSLDVSGMGSMDTLVLNGDTIAEISGSPWTEDGDSVTVAAGKLVGIGLSNPSYPLDVSGSINSSGNYYCEGTLAIDKAGSVLWFGTGSNNPKFGTFTNHVRVSGVSNYVSLFIDNSEDFMFDGTGLGIGTTTPAEMLDIGYASGVFLRSFRGTTDTDITGWITTNANGDTCYMYPNAAGNGIEVSTTKP